MAALRTIHLDQVFMGVHGMDARGPGSPRPNVLEAETDRALIDGRAPAHRRRRSRRKWGVIGIGSIARLDEADTLVTDAGLDPRPARSPPNTVREL